MVHDCDDDVRSDRLFGNIRPIETADDDVCNELMERRSKIAAPCSGCVVLMESFIAITIGGWQLYGTSSLDSEREV